MSGIRKLKIPVLMYHDVPPEGADLGSPPRARNIYTVCGSDFAEQMASLRERGFNTTVISDIASKCHNIKPTSKPVVITFDDGYISQYKTAAPIMEKHGLLAGFFITVGFVGQPGFMDWKEIRRLSEAGHLIGSHGMTHQYLSDMDDAHLNEELRRSKSIVEEKLGRDICALSLPGGKGGARVTQMAQEAGYSVICTSAVGPIRIKDNFLILNRIPIRGNTSAASFDRITELDPREMLIRRVIYSGKRLIAGMLGNNRYDRFRHGMLSLESEEQLLPKVV